MPIVLATPPEPRTDADMRTSSIFSHSIRCTIAAACWIAFAFHSTTQADAQTAYFRNGFKVGPQYYKPVAPVAPGWIDEGNPHVNTWAQREQLWWVSFNDSVLDALIQSAYGQNLTLRSAGMRVLQARAQRDIAAGDLFPQLQQGFGGYNRIAESLQIANRSPDRTRFFNDWILGGQLAWELDFWGQFRRNLAAADDRLDAQLEDYDDVLVILVSDVATAYIDYRTYQQRLAYAKQNLAIQSESVRLARIKFDAGTRESDIDLPQAQADLANIQALIPDLELGSRQAMNRLSVLLGLPPADLTRMLGASPIPLPPPDLALGVPADLLRQRPDVRRAERELAAQCEEIGIAVADLYPHISINGTIFVNSEKFSNLFTPKGWGGAVGPAFRWDILNYGRLQANIRLQEARFNELIYIYQHKVLVANEEVEDSIAGYLYSHEKVIALKNGADVSIEAVNIGTKRYQEGVSDFNRLSNLQVVIARQQDWLARSQGEVAQSWVDVYRSLGGGWQIRLANPQPYQPGIAPPPTPTGDTLPPPNQDPAAQPQAQSAPADSEQASETALKTAVEAEAKTTTPKPTVLTRLAAVKNFVLHRGSAAKPTRAPAQLEIPPFEHAELLSPTDLHGHADWSDLVETPSTDCLSERTSRWTRDDLLKCASGDLSVTLQSRTEQAAYQATESMIEVTKVDFVSPVPSAPIATSESTTSKTSTTSLRNEVAIAAAARGQQPAPLDKPKAVAKPGPETREPADKHTASKLPSLRATLKESLSGTTPAKQAPTASTTETNSGGEIPNIQFKPEVRSCRNPAALAPTMVR